MPSSFVLSLLFEFFRVRLPIAVIKSLKPGSHTKIVNEKRVLVYVLEDTEFATISERQTETRAEVVMGIQVVRFLRFSTRRYGETT